MKILVIGDTCIDIFRYGEVRRLAPEAPVPVIVPEYETVNPGMSGNVVENLKALGCEVEFISNKSKIKKIRYVCSKYNHLLLRVDENDSCENININHNLESIPWEKYDAVIISDYCKGFLTENDIYLISQRHSLTFLDTKKELHSWADNISFIKINNQEWENNRKFLQSSEIKNKTIITKGKNGCEFKDKLYPTTEVPVKDLSGAGDTFLCGLVVEYLKTRNIEKAIIFAQECTTIVVQKLGVATV